MSALRLGRRPDGTRDIRIEEPARARVSGQVNHHSLTLISGWVVQGEPGEVEQKRVRAARYRERERA